MSHNVLIKNVKITSIPALQRAIAELNAEGIRVSLEDRKQFRTYRGQPNRCDYCISLPDANHDVGLVKQEDGSYLPYYDPYGMPRNGEGVSCRWEQRDGNEAFQRTAIGKLLQRYATCVAEDSLTLSGNAFTREYDNEGNIVLTAQTF